MRVNIQYSVELDEVPKNIIHLMEAADLLITEISSDNLTASVEGQLANNNFKDALASISDLREKLMKLDHRLDDCMRILVGYQQVMADPSNFLPQSIDQPEQHQGVDGLEHQTQMLSSKINDLQSKSLANEGGFE